MTDEHDYRYDLFISYNRADEEWAEQLAARLEREDHRGRKLKVFFAPWDIQPGEYITESLEEALPQSRKVGLVVTPEAMRSEWVKIERLVTVHIDAEERQRRLIPLYRRPCEKLPALLRGIKAINFEDDAQFEKGYQELLAVVKGESLRRGAQQEASAEVSLPPSIPRPPTGSFVARYNREGGNLLELLRDELSPNNNQLVVLWGDGGVGKTTLAYETLRAMVGDFGQRIIWASPELRASLTFGTLLDEIATQLGHAEVRQLALAPKEERVLQLIAEAPALVVLDNFETVKRKEQKLCLDFLADRARCPALITTRKRVTHKGTSNIAVEVMKPEEAREFLDNWVKREAGNPHVFDEIDRDHIIEAADHNPLVMQWVVAQIDRARDPDAVVRDLSRGKGDAAARVFGNTFKLLDEDARCALLALSLFTPSASREALAKVTGLDKSESFDEAVGQLSDYWLVKLTGKGKRLSIQGLTRDLAQVRLAEHKQADEFHRCFVAYFRLYVVERSEPTPENYDALEKEKDNLLGAAEEAFTSRDWETVILMTRLLTNAATNASGVLIMRGYWDEAVRLAGQAIQAARSAPDEAAVATLSLSLASLYRNRGDNAEAQSLYADGLEIQKRLGDHQGIALTKWGLGNLSLRQGNVAGAKELYYEALEAFRKLGDELNMASILHQLGVVAMRQGEPGEARRFFNESFEVMKKFGKQNSVANILHNLAALAQDEGDSAEARRLYNESLSISRRFGSQRVIAGTLLNLALLTEREADRAEAARLYREALRILEKLGSPDTKKARKGLARVEDKIV
jgi:tetratricopeptide (TPR) repeat protein